MLRLASECDVRLFCYEGDGTVPLGQAIKDSNIKEGNTVAVVIGSEGGFSQKEVDAAVRSGMQSVGLGKRILRTETAPIFVLSALSYATELQ
jgi:16S rRNA (uracil1498-N3)-methyltransferase